MNPSVIVRESPVSDRPRTQQRIFFSFPMAMAALLVVLALLTVRARFDDPDMWWHLKTGEVIYTTHSIPLQDTFSYTTNRQASVPHEWLAQVSLYAVYRLGGYTGLMFWLAAFSSAVVVAGYGLCSLYSGNAKVAFAGALLIWLFSTVGLSMRPQLIGYLFLILEMLVLELGRTRDRRWFLALPFLFCAWVNIHGSFMLGMAVAATYLFTSLFQFEAGLLEAKRWSKESRNLLGLALLASFALLFVNPDGWRQVAYPLNTMLHLPINTSAVQEWQPLAMNTTRGVALLLVAGGILLAPALGVSQLLLHELVLLVLGTWLATGHQRMLFVFGILTAPTLSRMFAHSWDHYDPQKDRNLPNLVLIAICALVAVISFPSRANLTEQVRAGSPVAAVDFIRGHHLSGPMLNEWVDGGYLIWALPEHPVFVDGRGDVFEWSGSLKPYEDWATLQSDPRELLDHFKIGFCLLGKNSPMAHVLPLLGNWKQIYADDNSVIFQRT